MAEEAAKEDEPTMEEILASIRRIISEDGEEGEAADTAEAEDSAAPAEQAEEPEEPAETEANGQDAVDDILELTEEVDEEPEVEPEAAAEEDTEPETEPEIEEDPEESAAAEAVLDEGEIDKLVSDETEDKAKASFAELSALLVAGYEGSGNTLEGLVRELLKPMLRSWLDENLPRIVEDAVEREVARISRRDR